ncbi:hypothetical protein LX36DRAFT_162398 [Colletotrichum falcatum]|nr:hypothetical protein LX36DRAFT_162398 [Colletotrichum falcatum]
MLTDHFASYTNGLGPGQCTVERCEIKTEGHGYFMACQYRLSEPGQPPAWSTAKLSLKLSFWCRFLIFSGIYWNTTFKSVLKIDGLVRVRLHCQSLRYRYSTLRIPRVPRESLHLFKYRPLRAVRTKLGKVERSIFLYGQSKPVRPTRRESHLPKFPRVIVDHGLSVPTSFCLMSLSLGVPCGAGNSRRIERLTAARCF